MTSSHEARAIRTVPLSQRVMGGTPARTLDDAVKLADPFTPLDPNADSAIRGEVDAYRGGDRLLRIARNIRRSGGTPTLHFLTGHTGSGKTTELLRFKDRLVRTQGNAPTNTVLYLDAEEDLDIRDVDLEDLVVALWSVIFRDHPAVAAKALAPVWKEKVHGTLRELVLNLPDKVPDALSMVLGQIKLTGPDMRLRVRMAVGAMITALIRALNTALAQIKDDPADSVVLLIDNLEKMAQGRLETVERLYLERMGALKELDAHLVITAPVYLCYATAGASLVGLYGGEVVLLPMIKVRRRASEGGGDDPAGLAAMVELLEKRFDFGVLFEGGRGAGETIARLSGGCIRHALHMVKWAANEHDVPPVSTGSVEMAAKTFQAQFERALPEASVPMLRRIQAENRFPSDCPPDTKRDLLRHLFVLEYQNGEPDPWYAVHPLVERCLEVRAP